MALTPYAWTDEYVVPGGAGGNDGSSFANAWDITQVAASLANGKRMNFAGNFTLGASLVWAVTLPSAVNPEAFRGWKGDLSAPAVSFSDMPSVDGAGSYGWQPGSFQLISGMRFTNGTGLASVSSDNISIDLFRADNHTGTGIDLDNYVTITRSRLHDNGSAGANLDLGAKILFSEIYDNVADGLEFTVSAGAAIIGNFIARNVNGIDLGNTQNLLVALNTLDDNSGHAIDSSASTGPNVLVANQITNNTNGVGTLGALTMLYNNLYGNTSDGTGTPHLDVSNTALDPQYVNVASNDYEIQNASLMGVSVPLLGDVNIGAWQQNVGGGGGGGMIVHPGMTGGLRG